MNTMTNIWKDLLASRKGKFSVIIIGFCLLLAVFADFIANERPFYASLDGNSYFPIIHEYGEYVGFKPYDFIYGRDWSEIKFDNKIEALISYSPSQIYHYSTPYLRPGIENHLLGTDGIGRDVAAIVVHGCRYAIWVGFLSLFIAGVLGVFIGAITGYFGDSGIRASAIQYILWFSLIFLFFFYLLYGDSNNFFALVLLFLLCSLMVTYVVFCLLGKTSFFYSLKKYSFPLDIVTMRVIEIYRAIPGIFILLALISFFKKPSLWNVILIIGFLKWPAIARLMRAEFLKIKEQDYIQSAKSLGISDWMVIRKYALPNSLSSIIVAITFGVSSAILLESTISFLGIGINPNQVTWGHLLSDARSNFTAWWLAIFPGAALFMLIFALNNLGDCLSEILNPKEVVSMT